MYLTNSPEFMIIWLAILSIGCAPAFINYNLEGKALLHCLDVCATQLVIVDDDAACRARIENSREDIEKRGSMIVYLDSVLKGEVSARDAIVPGDEYREGVTPSFPFALIYTRYAPFQTPSEYIL